jgi:hypothetical protein
MLRECKAGGKRIELKFCGIDSGDKELWGGSFFWTAEVPSEDDTFGIFLNRRSRIAIPGI